MAVSQFYLLTRAECVELYDSKASAFVYDPATETKTFVNKTSADKKALQKGFSFLEGKYIYSDEERKDITKSEEWLGDRFGVEEE